MSEVKRTMIAELLRSGRVDTEVVVKGWVRTKRGNKNVAFIALNDGSTINNIQIVVDVAAFDGELLKRITTGACICARGVLVESVGSGQRVEVQARELEVYGEADPETYPLQKKGHTLEFLREIAHLRPRTNTFGAVLRIRHAMAFAIHKFFNDKGFYYLHTPIVTASDAEGAGAMFQVTTLDMKKPPRTEEGKIDYSQDFFGRSTNLTVSGQLEGELGATALSQIYTFGPTFRAENSNTPRHLAEFWMIEPEMAFYELEDNMDLAEEFLKYLIRYALDNCMEDLEFLNKMYDDGLIERLRSVVAEDFVRLNYTEGVEILKASGEKFEFPVDWGCDLQSEHERYLVEKHFRKLSQGDQGILHEAERRRKDRPCHGRALPEDRRDHRRFGEGGRLREARYPHQGARYEHGYVVVVYGYPSLRLGAPQRFRTRVREAVAFRDRYGEHPRCDTFPAYSQERRVLTQGGLCAERRFGTVFE